MGAGYLGGLLALERQERAGHVSLLLAFVRCDQGGVRRVLSGVKVTGGIIALRLKGKIRLTERAEGK